MLIDEKLNGGISNSSYKRYNQLPLTARPLDLIYTLFFSSHLVASLLLDCQYVYPTKLVPSILNKGLQYYIATIRDPLIGGVFNAFGDSKHLLWFKSFLMLEIFFQVPVFVLGINALKKGSIRIYPLLAVYGASSATTTLACVLVLLQTPDSTPHTIANNIASVSPTQRLVLLCSYIAFFLVPFVMAVDMFLRLCKIIDKAIKMNKYD